MKRIPGYAVKDTVAVVGDQIAIYKPAYKEYDGVQHCVDLTLVTGTVIDYDFKRELIRVKAGTGRFVWIKMTTLKRGFWRKPWSHPLRRELELQRAYTPQPARLEYPVPTFHSYVQPQIQPRRPVLVLEAC